jgi:hypothetical protein
VIGDDGVTKTKVANTDGGARAPDQSGQERVKYEFQSITALTRSSSMIAMSTASGVRLLGECGLRSVAIGLGIDANAQLGQLRIAPRGHARPPGR